MTNRSRLRAMQSRASVWLRRWEIGACATRGWRRAAVVGEVSSVGRRSGSGPWIEAITIEVWINEITTKASPATAGRGAVQTSYR